jgi:hypothetical protein
MADATIIGLCSDAVVTVLDPSTTIKCLEPCGPRTGVVTFSGVTSIIVPGAATTVQLTPTVRSSTDIPLTSVPWTSDFTASSFTIRIAAPPPAGNTYSIAWAAY